MYNDLGVAKPLSITLVRDGQRVRKNVQFQNGKNRRLFGE